LDWSTSEFERRAAVFLKAADLLATRYRPIVNAATMLGQSKTAHQAEIDSACELIDFFRFNPHYAERLYTEQPISATATWNYLDYRPLEGPIVEIVPGGGRGDRLLREQALRVVGVEAEEIDQLASRVDLRLVCRLRLAEHGRGVHDRAVPRGEQVGGLEEYRRPPLELRRGPVE